MSLMDQLSDVVVGQMSQQAAQKTGLNEGLAAQLMPMAMAAPMVLASLGRAKREQSLDASALAGLVTEESVRAQKAAPSEPGGLMKYPVIFEANKPMLSDPDKICPGQTLRIPTAG